MSLCDDGFLLFPRSWHPFHLHDCEAALCKVELRDPYIPILLCDLGIAP